jgi:hypothetical protein
MPRARDPRTAGREEEGHEAARPEEAAPLTPSAELVLAAQRGFGNRAVANVLARNPNPALASAQPKVKHTTGAEVDAYLDSSPFFRDLVEDKVKGGTKAEGHVHIHDPDGFKTVCVAYYMSRLNAATGATYTKEEAEAQEPNTNAFRDGTGIHLHQDRGEPGTAIHESMHLFCDTAVRDQGGFNLNEGFTEYFAKELCKEQKIKRGDFYPDQYRAVLSLCNLVGEDLLADAYFKGDIDSLRTAVDTKAGKGIYHSIREFFGGAKKGGAGTFDTWVGHIKAGEYDEAKDLW